MPMWIGHRFVDPDDTPPAMTVSAAPAGGAKRSKAAMANAIALGLRACHPLLRYAGAPPARRPITRLPDAPCWHPVLAIGPVSLMRPDVDYARDDRCLLQRHGMPDHCFSTGGPWVFLGALPAARP